MHQPFGQGEQLGFGPQRDTAPRPSLGTINVIFATPIREIGPSFGIMPISPQVKIREKHRETKRRKCEEEPVLRFNEAGKGRNFLAP